MHQRARFMLVQKNKLTTYPKAFQEYVVEYFDEIQVAGGPHFVAFLELSVGRSPRKGVAPCHNVDLRCYKEGLNGVGLSDWISKQTSKKGSGIIEYGHSWDDGCPGPPIMVD
jgi:hypothetical protein